MHSFDPYGRWRDYLIYSARGSLHAVGCDGSGFKSRSLCGGMFTRKHRWLPDKTTSDVTCLACLALMEA